MKKWIFRLGFGLLFALPFMLVTGVWAQAETVDVHSAYSNDLDCESCHPAFHNSWQTSAHGTASDGPEFVAVLREQCDPL